MIPVIGNKFNNQNMNGKVESFVKEIEKSALDKSFSRLTISNAKDKKSDLKKVLIKLAEIKGQIKLSFVYRHTTKDITKNYDMIEWLSIISGLFDSFYDAIIFKTDENIELKSNEKWAKIIRSKASNESAPDFSHNIEKIRMIETKGNIYLRELGVLNSAWEIRQEMNSKFRQIDKYIEIFDNLVKWADLPHDVSVMDMWSGKWYLTFAVHDYLLRNNFSPNTIWVEFRKDMVEKCNSVARKSGFDWLTFREWTILNTQIDKNDILIALHACDTATDEAIHKWIISASKLIICAPCCHKQIRKEFNVNNDFSSFLKHWILEERQAELITDAIRSLILEMYWYKTKVFEFISLEHTAKNIMIVWQKSNDKADRVQISKKIQSIKDFYWIKVHHLEKLLWI
ncbi:MAG: hypothetical protein ACD_2C00120G0002 [uncultured bacterium (gcode 4)]|uniref:Methyltransferase domain-containing protein n=1 Tax=uncultured bacterium (gcode 4) TaxID=1234023 RepID=K2G608_9BACT|nr:MAG: hypothetical protein ACD_2C00120G0002 [uncultured bacterium (gcode 4)]